MSFMNTHLFQNSNQKTKHWNSDHDEHAHSENTAGISDTCTHLGLYFLTGYAICYRQLQT